MSRRVVLGALTAELPRGAPPPPSGARAEYYHELELYRQLLALPEPEEASRVEEISEADEASQDKGDGDDVSNDDVARSENNDVDTSGNDDVSNTVVKCVQNTDTRGVVVRTGLAGLLTVDQATQLVLVLGDAARMFPQRQPSAPVWRAEVGGRAAPRSLPGLRVLTPPRSPAKCETIGASRLVNEPSPSSSEESCSPLEVNAYRRLGERCERPDRCERAPLMRRLALGLSGALALPDDDDSMPLVVDTPTTPTNASLCGAYTNEAAEAEARTRRSNREPPTPPVRGVSGTGTEDMRCSNANKNCSSAACSVSGSSSASSCGNNNPAAAPAPAPPPDPDLKTAPWFQQGIPREIALEVLSNAPVGTFLVRASSSQPACHALSVRVPRDFAHCGIAHYLILRTNKGYKIKGFTKEFTSLSALVTHHSVMPELLPVPLRLARGAGVARGGRPPERVELDALHPPASPRPRLPRTPRHHLHNFLTQLDV